MGSSLAMGNQSSIGFFECLAPTMIDWMLDQGEGSEAKLLSKLSPSRLKELQTFA
jgi:hypothetical protein